MNIRKWLCSNLGWIKWLYNLCDCQRYESVSTPPPEPEPPQPPEPEPPEPPQPEPMPEPIPDIWADCLNGFQWWIQEAWNLDNFYQREIGNWTKEYTEIVRRQGIDKEVGFAFTSSGRTEHHFLNTKSPWIYDRSIHKFILSEPNEQYYNLVKRWLIIKADLEVDYVFQLLMAFDYNIFPFRNNLEGIKIGQIWDEPARPYIEYYVRRMMECYQEIYGKDYKPYVKLVNEPSHYGSGVVYHKIMYFHEWLRKILDDYTTLDHMIFDLHLCEGAIGECRAISNCPKPEVCDRGGKHGNKEDDYKGIQEYHAYSVWQNFTKKVVFQNKLIPAIDLFVDISGTHVGRFTEDCGAGREYKGGPFLGHGTVWPPENSGKPVEMAWADAEQSYEMAKNVFLKTRGKKNKRLILGWWPINNIQWVAENGKVYHVMDHRLEVIQPEIERLKEMVRAWHEVNE